MLISAFNSLCAYILRELSEFRESIFLSPLPCEHSLHHEIWQPEKGMGAETLLYVQKSPFDELPGEGQHLPRGQGIQ